ncbi:ABC-three component system middle component 7 [Mariniflexile sp. HMF6888]|uniref:ABC-three component system middle component 7 n=1 Tax=Mariniflexile sp. HMF6888 TaxID=3373086 RepID=UPI00379CABC5
MIYPNKNIRFEESIIYKMISILEERKKLIINIHELYNETKNKFKNTDEFIVSLDVLYALDMINVDFENENIEYVKRN